MEALEPRWLKLKAARDYSGIGMKRLKELALDPDCPIVGFQDPDNARGDWIFDRLTIDQYREAQSGQGRIHQAYLDAARRFGL